MKIAVKNTASGVIAFSLPVSKEAIELDPGMSISIDDPDATELLKSPVIDGWEKSGKIHIGRQARKAATTDPAPDGVQDEAALHAAVANATAAGASGAGVDGETDPPKETPRRRRKTAQD